jgi:hypothetical protein
VRTRRLLAPLLLVAAIGQAVAASEWTELAPKACRCRFSMPGTPTYTSQPKELPAKPFSVDQWYLETETAAYIVAMTTFPGEAISAKERDALLDGTRDGLLKLKGRKVVQDKRISHNGNPGRELVIEDQNTRRFTMRLFLVKTVLYQYGVTTAASERNPPGQQTFFDSFRFDR